MTLPVPGYCDSDDSAYWIDPFNVIFWAYGEGNRMADHADRDTAWGRPPYSTEQTICGDTDESPGNYYLRMYLNFDHLSRPVCGECNRDHFRIWYAPHAHYDHYSKWSVITAHREAWNGSRHVLSA